MSITSIPKNASEITIRLAEVALDVDQGGSFARFEFGIVEELKLRITPINRGRDSFGRTRTAGYDAVVSFKMMQTANTALEKVAAFAGARPQGNLVILASGQNIEITGVCPTYDFDIDAAGGVSAVTIAADRYFTPSQLTAIFLQTGGGQPPV